MNYKKRRDELKRLEKRYEQLLPKYKEYLKKKKQTKSNPYFEKQVERYKKRLKRGF